MSALIIIPATSGTGAFTSNQYIIEQEELPAQLIVSAGLATTETVKLQSSIDDGENFIDLTDENGDVEFAATGRNIIPINVPLLFKAVKSTTASATVSVTLSFGKGV